MKLDKLNFYGTKISHIAMHPIPVYNFFSTRKYLSTFSYNYKEFLSTHRTKTMMLDAAVFEVAITDNMLDDDSYLL